jgi:hypothetical protein
MTTQQSSVDLRILIVAAIGFPIDMVTDPSDTLVGVNTTILPDGAVCYVISAKAVYRLQKESTATQLVGGQVVAPIAGPGRWVLESGAAGSRTLNVFGTAALAAGSGSAVTQNTWAALPSGAGFYSFGVTNNSPFSLDTTTGILTYNGADETVLVSASATVADATAAQAVELAIDHNAALITTTTFDGTAGAANVEVTTAGLGTQISTRKIFAVTVGDTFRVVFRDTTATPGNLNATHFNLLATPA